MSTIVLHNYVYYVDDISFAFSVLVLLVTAKCKYCWTRFTPRFTCGQKKLTTVEHTAMSYHCQCHDSILANPTRCSAEVPPVAPCMKI